MLKGGWGGKGVNDGSGCDKMRMIALQRARLEK